MVDITWRKLIIDSENEILSCQDRIHKLRKAIRFFTHQERSGVDFPSGKKKTLKIS